MFSHALFEINFFQYCNQPKNSMRFLNLKRLKEGLLRMLFNLRLPKGGGTTPNGLSPIVPKRKTK